MVLDSAVDKDLERAAHRAYVRNISAKLVRGQHVNHDGTEFFDVASFTTAGLMHRVRLDYTANGINASCDCTAGQHGKICQHVAVALQASEALTEPEPEPTKWYGESASQWLRSRLGGA